MAKKKTVDIISLKCTKCGMKNYTVQKSKKLEEKFEFSKYCKKCKAHTKHKETKVD